MPELIRTSTHPKYKNLVDKMLDLQGERDGIVLSVGLRSGGRIVVGIKKDFKSLDEFGKYLRSNGLPSNEMGKNGQDNYQVRQDEVTIEFYERS